MHLKNKYDFIKDLLVDKKLSQSQREKLFMLTAKELNLEGSLEERINRIEDVLNISPIKGMESDGSEPPKPEQESEQDDKLPKYIYPSNLYKFLFDYNQDPILKYTCHLVDNDALEAINELCETDTYDYNLHHNKIIESFKEIEENHRFAPPKTKALIRGYLTGKNFEEKKIPNWGEGMAFSWVNEEIEKWVNKNHCPPNPDAGLRGNSGNPGNLSIGSVFKSKFIPDSKDFQKEFRIRNFSDLVIYFKHLFHIRYDNSLHHILLFQNIQKRWDDKIKFIINESLFPKNIEFFTDVGKLIDVYNRIIELIIEVSKKQEKPLVELKLREFENSIELSIYHKNSKYQKTLQNTIERPGDTYTKLIENQINGLCNFYVKADFGDGNCAKVNIWDKEFAKDGPRKRRVVDECKNFEGVEHILEFKKK